MSQLSNTEHVLLPFHDQSPTQRRRCMCVCVPLHMSWLSKDWNKASKSKRQGLLHRRVQVPTLWGEVKCVRERASDERQHYFRERGKNNNKKQRHWREDMTSCSKKLFREHKATSVSGASPYRLQIETDRSRNDFDIWRGVFIYWYKVQWE